MNWDHPQSWEEVCRRHAARTRWNSLRKYLADQRRVQIMALLVELGGLQRGTQSEIARQLKVHRSVISKDLKRLMPLAVPCPTCGAWQTRRWTADD